MPAALLEHPDYQVLRELGRGGMGVVYLAEHRLTGRKEVLKIVGSQLMSRKGVRERFLREIRAAAQLNHPNVVTAFSASQSGESLVYSMQYIEGHDLAELVEKSGPLPVAHACNFIHQAALGLQHAHDRGMVHRDIKPSNLMLAREGNKPVVKILDFGLAKVASEGHGDGGLTREGQMLGTPEYIAPEQIRDAQSADIRADIYSLGCTLYCLLAGRPPFHTDKLWDLYQAHLSSDARPLDLLRGDVPAELAAVVAKMMAKEPGRRFQTPGEVAAALRPFSRNKPIADAPSTLGEGTGPAPPLEVHSLDSRSAADVAPAWQSEGRVTVLEHSHVEGRAATDSQDISGRGQASWRWPALAGSIGIAGTVLGYVLSHGGGPAIPASPASPRPVEIASSRPASTAVTGRGAQTPGPAAPEHRAPPAAEPAVQVGSMAPAAVPERRTNPDAVPPHPPIVGPAGPMPAGPAGQVSPPPGRRQAYAMVTNPNASAPRGSPVPARPPVPASPPTGQADRRMRAYAEFAAFVRNLEHETEKIPYNRLALRKERYWGPLEAFVSQLIGKYRINPNRLAPLIEEGYKQSWPTEETGDRDMVARWFHHCKIEYKLIMRRADAQASRSALDSLTSMAVQQATAAGTLQNSANAAAGRRALGGR